MNTLLCAALLSAAYAGAGHSAEDELAEALLAKYDTTKTETLNEAALIAMIKVRGAAHPQYPDGPYPTTHTHIHTLTLCPLLPPLYTFAHNRPTRSLPRRSRPSPLRPATTAGTTMGVFSQGGRA